MSREDGARSVKPKTLFDVRTGDVHFTIFGWWIRMFWGVTGRADRPLIRWSKFYGYRLVALRLWRFEHPMDARLVGIQWRRA